MVEIIVVLAIVGMVLAIAVPFFGRFSHRVRLESAARAIYMPLVRARLEAVKRGNNVYVEMSTNPAKVSFQQLVMFVDTSNSGPNKDVFDSGDTQIGAYPVPPAGNFAIDTYTSMAPAASSQTVEFIFTPFGSMDVNSTSKAAFVQDASGNLIRVGVASSSTGKVVMSKLVGGAYVVPPWTWY